MKTQRKIDGLNDIKEYYKQNRYLPLLRTTKKIKDLFWSKKASISLLISIFITTLFLLLLFLPTDTLNNLTLTSENIDITLSLIREVLPTIIGGLFALLGLTIGGLAIVTGTISSKVITEIRKQKSFPELISVIFNFYFCGSIIGLSIILGIISYISTYFSYSFSLLLFLFWTLVQTYFIIFSILYSVMLLGTCIRIFLLRYLYTYED